MKTISTDEDAMKALQSITENDESANSNYVQPEVTGSIDINPSDIIHGKWYDFDVDKFADKGKYYQAGLRFQVQAASVTTIKYFSAMDDEFDSINDAVLKLIGTHIRVIKGNQILNSLDVIYEHDRLRAVLIVAIYTGTGQKLTANVTCKGEPLKPCNHNNSVEVSLQNLSYNLPTEKGESLYVPTRGTFVIEPRGMKKFEYKLLTLNDADKVTSYVRSKYHQGDKIDKQFSDFAGFYMHKMKTDETMDAIYSKYLKDTSDIKTLSFMTMVTENDIDFSMKYELQATCEKCSRLDYKPATKFGKLKHLFLAPSTDIEY